jgi:hypothetical protein
MIVAALVNGNEAVGVIDAVDELAIDRRRRSSNTWVSRGCCERLREFTLTSRATSVLHGPKLEPAFASCATGLGAIRAIASYARATIADSVSLKQLQISRLLHVGADRAASAQRIAPRPRRLHPRRGERRVVRLLEGGRAAQCSLAPRRLFTRRGRMHAPERRNGVAHG